MATIRFVAVGTFTSGTTAAISPPLPAGVAVGDLLLLLCETAAESVTAPTGWTEIGAQASQSTGTAAAIGATRLAVFYRFYTTGLAAPTTNAVTNHIAGQTIALRGVNRRNPFSGATSGFLATASASLTMPAVSTTAPNSMIVLCVANDRDSTGAANFAAAAVNANLTSITERMDATTASGAGGGVALWTAYFATVGSTGTSTATNAASNTYGYLTLALRPTRRVFSFS